MEEIVLLIYAKEMLRIANLQRWFTFSKTRYMWSVLFPFNALRCGIDGDRHSLDDCDLEHPYGDVENITLPYQTDVSRNAIIH